VTDGEDLMENLNQMAPNDSYLDEVRKLRSGCQYRLSQCLELLNSLSESDYQASNNHSSSIGGHVRHILDRFQSFFLGLPKQHIDYDKRGRDKSVENNLESAKFALASAQRQLDGLELNQVGRPQLVITETVHNQGLTAQVASTAERELMSLVTHSTHHLAIIALLARALGRSVDSSLGKAPSTVVFEALK
jgi:uncharacterized damage-inducible protein DinB